MRECIVYLIHKIVNIYTFIPNLLNKTENYFSNLKLLLKSDGKTGYFQIILEMRQKETLKMYI